MKRDKKIQEERGGNSRELNLRVSEKEKTKNEFAHSKNIMDAYVASGSFHSDVINPESRDIRIFYEAYNNKLPDSYFKYVTNPLNSTNENYTNWPARLRPYSIIRPKIDLLMGEYEKRPFSYAVKVNNVDAYNAAEEQIYAEVLKNLQQQFINTLNERGMETDQPSQPVEPPAKIKEKYISNYKDQRAIMGEAALEIVIDRLNIIELFKDLFQDWLIAGECYTYKGIRGGKMVHERVSPLDLSYDKSPDEKYVENGQWAVRRLFMTLAEVNDNFYEELKESDLQVIEDSQGSLLMQSVGTGIQNFQRSDVDLRSSKIPVYHCVWKYMMKIGILSFTDEFGQVQEIEVPENFKADKTKGESIEWFWVNEVWEGYRIADEIYLGIKPIECQRNSVNNLSQCKLPYNGRRFSDLHSNNVSIVELGLPYETLHRILHYNLEKTIAKSKGKIALIDYNSVPKKFGWDEEKFMYFAEATGWGFVDRNQPGVDKQYNSTSVLDLGLYQHLESLIEVMEYVKREWNELLGISPQREGNLSPNETKGGAQMAVAFSAVISERLFSRFEDFVRSELQGLLDVSKLAWLDGFEAVHTGDDMRSIMLKVEPSIYCEADFGVTISRTARDLQNLEMVRQQVQAFAQNGVTPSVIVDIVQAQSLSKLRHILQKFEAKSMEAQQQSALSEQEYAERLEMIKGSFEELKGVVEERLINVEYDRKEEIEHIKGAYSTYKNVEGTGDNNNNGIPDPIEVQKLMQTGDKMNRDERLGYEKLRSQERMKTRDQQIKLRDQQLKEKEMGVKMDIAKLQAKTAIRNKVAGEKSKSK